MTYFLLILTALKCPRSLDDTDSTDETGRAQNCSGSSYKKQLKSSCMSRFRGLWVTDMIPETELAFML